MDGLKSVLDRLAREPVMAVAAVLASIEAAWPSMSPAWKIALGLWGAYVQRSFSTSKKNLDDTVEVVADSARNQALADVASLVPPSI